MTKDELIKNINLMLTPLQEVDKKEKLIIEKRKMLTCNQEYYKRQSRGPSTLIIVLTLYFSVAISISLVWGKEAIMKFFPTSFLNKIIDLLGWNIFFPIAIIFFFLMFFIQSRHTKKTKKYYDKKISGIQAEINLLQSETQFIYESNSHLFSFIPEYYRYPIAITYFYQALINGRADSLKEAINLFEEQLHRWKIENYQQQLLEIQNQQKVYLEKINHNSKVAAAASTIAAINTF